MHVVMEGDALLKDSLFDEISLLLKCSWVIALVMHVKWCVFGPLCDHSYFVEGLTVELITSLNCEVNSM